MGWDVWKGASQALDASSGEDSHVQLLDGWEVNTEKREEKVSGWTDLGLVVVCLRRVRDQEDHHVRGLHHLRF